MKTAEKTLRDYIKVNKSEGHKYYITFKFDMPDAIMNYLRAMWKQRTSKEKTKGMFLRKARKTDIAFMEKFILKNNHKTSVLYIRNNGTGVVTFNDISALNNAMFKVDIDNNQITIKNKIKFKVV